MGELDDVMQWHCLFRERRRALLTELLVMESLERTKIVNVGELDQEVFRLFLSAARLVGFHPDSEWSFGKNVSPATLSRKKAPATLVPFSLTRTKISVYPEVWS